MPDNSPPEHSLAIGELAIELDSMPRRLWMGVPDDIDRSGRVQLRDLDQLLDLEAFIIARHDEMLRELKRERDRASLFRRWWRTLVDY